MQSNAAPFGLKKPHDTKLPLQIAYRKNNTNTTQIKTQTKLNLHLVPFQKLPLLFVPLSSSASYFQSSSPFTSSTPHPCPPPAKHCSTHRFPPLPSPCSHHCLSFLPPPCPTSTPSNSDASPPWCSFFTHHFSSGSQFLFSLLSSSPSRPLDIFQPGFVSFFEGFSRTLFSAKKSLESMSFQLFDNMKNFILKVFLCLLPQALENPGWIKLAPKFEDFPTPTAIFKDFQGACEAEPCPTLMFVLFTFSLPPPSLTTVPCSATPYKYKGPTRAWGSVKHGSQLRNHSVLFCQLSGGSRHSDKGAGRGDLKAVIQTLR